MKKIILAVPKGRILSELIPLMQKIKIALAVLMVAGIFGCGETLADAIADALSASLDLCHRMGGKGGRARMRIHQDVLDRSQAFPLIQWLHLQVFLPEGSSDGF